MGQILIVEDSKSIAGWVCKRLAQELSLPVVWVQTMAAARDLIETPGQEFDAALLDLNLPDAPDGEIVDYVVSRKIPAIAFTANMDEATQAAIWSKGVVDYVGKEGDQSVLYMASMIRRLALNKRTRVLVVDDSRMVRHYVQRLLTTHQYIVHEATDGVAALQILREYPDVCLVITDYNMPNMDGFELARRIREVHSREEMGVLGVSASTNTSIAVRFLKNGANDFLDKPFSAEQFYCRVTQNVQMIEHFRTIRELSRRDYLTGLYNRRHLVEAGERLLNEVRKAQGKAAVALLDIDFFKHINDQFGHDMGDMVLQQLARLMLAEFREPDLVARHGGEEFCVVAHGEDPGSIFRRFDAFRETIACASATFGEYPIPFTVSIGLCMDLDKSLDQMVKQADTRLYEAKAGGRNCVRPSLEAADVEGASACS